MATNVSYAPRDVLSPRLNLSNSYRTCFICIARVTGKVVYFVYDFKHQESSLQNIIRWGTYDIQMETAVVKRQVISINVFIFIKSKRSKYVQYEKCTWIVEYDVRIISIVTFIFVSIKIYGNNYNVFGCFQCLFAQKNMQIERLYFKNVPFRLKLNRRNTSGMVKVTALTAFEWAKSSYVKHVRLLPFCGAAKTFHVLELYVTILTRLLVIIYTNVFIWTGRLVGWITFCVNTK